MSQVGYDVTTLYFEAENEDPDAGGKTGLRKIVHTLRPLQQISVRIAGHDHIARDPLTPQAEAILHALGIDPD